VVTDLDIGGTERMLVRLVTASDRARFRHTVISLTDGGALAPELLGSGIEVHALDMRRGLPTLAALIRAVRLLRQLRPDVIQTWLYHADLLGLVAGRMAGYRRLIWNLRCSDMDFSRYGWVTGLTVRLLAKLSALPIAIVANAEAGRRWHASIGYRPRQWAVIGNGIDLDRFRPDPDARQRWRQEMGFEDRTTVVGMVARRDPMKDHESVLAAAASLARPDIAFVLGGRGVDQDPALRALAAPLGSRVRLLPERADVAGLMAGLDIFVLASRFGEGFPNVVAEAMACAVPCVTTDVGDCAAMIGATGITVERGNVPALAQAIARLAADAAARRNLGRRARERAMEMFSLPAAVGRYEALYAATAEDRA
jgi:glycosyltransferase involved in cell wall biosynthesis